MAKAVRSKEATMAKTSVVETDGPVGGVLPDQVITSTETFDLVTGPPHEIAGLYFYHLLDELIDLARAISFDFFKRPQAYKDLGDSEVASDLARLHARYGYHETLLSREQRQKIFEGVFTVGEHQFMVKQNALLRAAALYSQRAYNTGEEMLRASFRDAAVQFKSFANTVTGVSLSWSRFDVLPELTDKTAYRILRDRGVRAVFGRNLPVAEEWPYQLDSESDEFVEEASRQLDQPVGAVLDRDMMNRIHEIALRGAEAIAAVLDFNGQRNPEVERRLILQCYTWHTALVQVVGPPAWTSMDGNRPLMITESLASP